MNDLVLQLAYYIVSQHQFTQRLQKAVEERDAVIQKLTNNTEESQQKPSEKADYQGFF